MAIAYYGTSISPNQLETAEGYLICRNVPIARTGPQEYFARELGLQDGDPERMVVVKRHPEDVFEAAALASFEGKPITDSHPPEDVLPENYTAYARGHVQNVRQKGEYVVADLYITDPGLASQVRHGTKRQVSCGYRCDYTADSQGGYKQTRIRGNHVAIVPLGRAGAAVSIQDAAQAAKKERRTTMSTFREEILRIFGMAAKDATPEEMTAMISTTQAAMDAEPALRPAENREKEEASSQETAIQRDALGDKLDRMLELLEALDQRSRPQERKLSDEGDLDDLLERLAKKAQGTEQPLVVPAEEENRDGSPTACQSSDSAMELLKKVRPAVAAIQDKKDRAKVVDALLLAINPQGKGMGEILEASASSAKKAADSREGSSFEKICQEQKKAYDGRNPHKKNQ